MQLYDAIVRLFTEVDHLERVKDTDDEWDQGRVELALSIAKRVRRDSTLVVRQIASLRDNQLQPGGHKQP